MLARHKKALRFERARGKDTAQKKDIARERKRSSSARERERTHPKRLNKARERETTHDSFNLRNLHTALIVLAGKI